MIDDVKRSIVENSRARLPGIPQANFFADPQSNFERPAFWLEFIEKKQVKGYAGFQMWLLTFKVVVAIQEADFDSAQDTTDIQRKTDYIDGLFVPNETLPFYTWKGDEKTARDWILKVKSFLITESKKDRAENKITGELIVTF